ncbi:PAS domain-containing protein [Hymenobacter tibetensis]|uniref:histidine kinase n=1 Tax=Hymenobacter tibetensis TaxID=497967 RepID=A0ABY4CVR1_9BACT|nr:PAS domain-containing protein [Hymenobacter tibetensis]UOG74361.1 PAS domain-containing protein [Hymenobacter tibetensis]
MPTDSPLSRPDADADARLAAEQDRRREAEAALAVAQTRITALEQQLTEAQESGRRHQAQLAALVQNLPVGLLLVDPAGQIQLVNSYFRSLFNLPPTAVLADRYPSAAPDTVSIDTAFQDPAAFSARARAIHQAGKTILNQEFVLADGRVVELDYLVLEEGQAGRLICYRDVSERHLREGQLRTLSYIPEQSPNAVVRLSAAGEVIYANPAAGPLLRALAIEEANEVGLLRTRLVDLVQHVLHTSGQQQQELQVANRHYLFTAVAVPDEKYATLYLTEVTARQQVEQQLGEQRLFYETILNQVPMAVAVVDTAFRYLYVNPAIEPDPVKRVQMIGKTNVEAGRERLRPVSVIEHRQRGFEEAMRKKEGVSWEETFPDGSRQRSVIFQLRPIVEADGQIRRLIASGIDITARKQAEELQQTSEALVREQQEFVRLIVDTLPNIVYVADAEGNISFRNAAFNATAARSQHIAAQKPALIEAQVEQIRAWRRQVMATGQPLNVEMLLTMNNDESCYLQVHMRPLQYADGRVEVLIVSTDITALKHAQQQAEENARAKEAFLSRMSHEIRTPLNGVMGMATLLEKTPLTPLQQDYLTTMQQAGHHLLALINDVLDLAKITTQHLQIAQAAFDLNGTLEGARQTIAALATQKGLLLTVEPVAPSVRRVLGDAYRLHQVLLNLLGNAVKFTEVGCVQLGAVVLKETAAEVTLRFWVLDTGIGIAPAQQERIFEAFTQASTASSHQAGGTGLGLAISEQLVRHMGGMLQVCSVPQLGTTFSFVLTLPRAHEPDQDALGTLPIDNYEALQGLRVLLAEDNAVNQWIATVVLEHWGVVVEAVDNGVDALVALTTRDFDAALLDIKMPGLTGVEVTEALRQHPDSHVARLPVIALTANAFEADRASYMAAGMDACVNKPFEEAELCRQLLRLTKR